MKTNLTRIIGTGLLLLGGAVMATAAGEAVLSPPQRLQALERGKALVATREITPVAVDPFHPEAFAKAVADMGRATGTGTTPAATEGKGGETTPRAPVGPRNDHELLQ